MYVVGVGRVVVDERCSCRGWGVVANVEVVDVASGLVVGEPNSGEDLIAAWGAEREARDEDGW